MRYIKLNNTQAKKIAGKYDSFNAIDPRFIEEDFYIVILEDLLPIAKRYIKKLITSGKVGTIDMSKTIDSDVVKLNSVFNETAEESRARVGTRVTKWDYTEKEIKDEL